VFTRQTQENRGKLTPVGIDIAKAAHVLVASKVISEEIVKKAFRKRDDLRNHASASVRSS